MKPAIDPYRQGDLDSLCGIYAIINALAALCPEMDESEASRLFRKLVLALAQQTERPIGALYDGLSQAALEQLLAIGGREMQRRLEVQLRVEVLGVSGEESHSLAKVWESLRSQLNRRQVAILGLTGAHDHWTVAYAVSKKVIRLLNSSERHVLLRSRCTTHNARTRFRLDPSAILLVKRGK